MEINYKQLTFAREYRGYSQTELAAKIKGLSQSNLSMFEKGIGFLSSDVIQRIIDFLEFPEKFFEKKISNKAEIAHYRKHANISKRDKMMIEFSNKLIGYIVDQMAVSLEFPAFTIKPIDLEDGYTPESAAKYTRKLLGLKDDPVKDICTILERNGIIIVELDANAEEFDGVSFKTDHGYPVIIINKSFSSDRKRYTIAHELGHIVMHISEGFIFPEHRDDKEKEREAFRFASEFLMPADVIVNSLRDLKFSYLIELKRIWLTSMASIIRRARDLGYLSPEKYKMFNIELSRKGYRREEPINVYIDEPKLFLSAYKMHKQELEYTDDIMATAFGLPLDVIKRFCSPQRGNSKLRVLI